MRGEEVSRQAPFGYEEVAKLLTPAETVVHSRDPVAAEHKDGIVLLDEEIQTIDDAGRRLIVDHRVERALTEAGAKRIAESVSRYRKGESTIHLLLAQTLPPDGAPLPVRPDAALLHSPQDDAGNSLYDDMGELRIIFPNVKPGSVTESIVAIKEDHSRMPGEFAATFVWAREWPRQTMRRLVEMPRELADRLLIASVGAGIPSVQKESLADGQRVRYVWQQEKTAGLTPERGRAPMDQAGPVTRLTTLSDWSGFTRWYEVLLEQRSRLSPELAAKVDAWTKDTPSPRETLDILFAKVAGEVRYTGLEFGSSALQPHDVCEVWDNQYGDCKDKANLLRAMLEHRGIAAHLILLQTEHAGKIDRRSPGWSQFDHAIVAVELPGEKGYVFCDPTIARGVPGLLGPGDVDREVLVLKGSDPEWTRTPAQPTAALRYGFDLKLAADGSLAGWFSLEASGFYGAAYADRCAKQGAPQTRSMLTNIIQDFYPSAEIVDLEQPAAKPGEPCRLRAYLVTSATTDDGNNAGGQGRSLSFPAKELAPNLGDQSARETAFAQVADRIEVDARIALPAGWTPGNPPTAYRLDSEAFGAEARWELRDKECRATLTMQAKESVVPPEQFPAYYNGARSLRSWLDQPLLLAVQGTAAANDPAAAEATDLAATDFPMMPSGEGQLELVDKKFPAEGSTARRRAALERTRQYFPQDKPTLFRVGIKLALLDLAADKAAAAAAQIRALLRENVDAVPSETLGWGEYILGVCLKSTDQTKEALDIFTRLARDPASPEARRAYAGWEAASLLQKNDPEEGIRLLLETLPCQSDAKAQQLALLGELLLKLGRGEQLSGELRKFLAQPSGQLDEVITALGQTARDLLADGHEDSGHELIRRLEDASHGSEAAGLVDNALGDAKREGAALAAEHRIQRNLKDFLAHGPLPPADPAQPTLPPKRSRAEITREMDAKEADGDSVTALRNGLELLAGFPPDKDFSHLLWRTAAFADWREKSDARPEVAGMVGTLLDLCDGLPADDHNRYEGLFLRAKRLERLHDIPGARRVYEALRDDAALPETFHGALYAHLGKVLESQGDLRGALAAYHETEGDATTLPSSADAQLRAAFIHLSFNERPEAFRLFDLLAKVKAPTLEKTPTAEQIKEMVALTRDQAKAEAYWDAAARWFPQWRDFLRDNVPALLGEDDQVVPVVPDLTELGRQIGQAVRDKDKLALVRSLRFCVQAARWQPGMTLEFGDIVLHSPQLLIADLLAPMRRLAIAISEGYALDESDSSRRNRVILTANLIDAGQPAKALEAAEDFRRRNKVFDDVGAFAMTRLWAVSLQQTGGDCGPAITALEGQLEAPKLPAIDRPLAISILAQLYTSAGRAADEEKLLTREIAHPDIQANADASRRLNARLTALRNENDASVQFSNGVAHWLEAHRPAWFDHAQPRDLSDPKLADADAFLRSPPSEFSKAETIKGEMLIASAASQPLERKINAWDSALYSLVQLCQTNRQVREFIEPILAESGFSDEVHAEAVFIAATTSAEKLQPAEFDHWTHDPLAARLTEGQREAIEPLRIMLDARADKPAADMEAAGRRILQKPAGIYALYALSNLFDRCLAIQSFPEAERLAKLIATMEIAPGIKQTRASLQLDYLRKLREARRWAPLQAELRRLTLAHFPPDTIERPTLLDEWRNRYTLDVLPAADARQVRLWQVKTWNWDVPDLYFWRGFIRGLSLTDGPEQALAQRLKVALLQLTTTDQDRLFAVDVVQDATDSDDPALRQWLTETLKPYRDSAKWPETYAAIRMREIRLALRLGQPVDLETELASVETSPLARQYGQHLRVEHFLQTRDGVRLKQALDALSPEELLRRNRLGINIPALELAGRTDEVALARDAARTELNRAVIRSWSEGLGTEATLVYRLLKQLPEADDAHALPEHWLAGCLALIRNEQTSLRLQMDDAHRRKDWQAQATLAAQAVAAFPTVYPYYYDEGEALYELGRKEEARHPLEVFTQYSKNDLEYPQAVKWLAESRDLPAVR